MGGFFLLDKIAHLTWGVASELDDAKGIEHARGVLELVINGVLVSLEGIQRRDSHPRTEVFAALGQPVLIHGARSFRHQVQQPGREMILSACQVHDASELMGHGGVGPGGATRARQPPIPEPLQNGQDHQMRLADTD